MESEGYLTTAIRRRWYDMLYFASKYIMGYLPDQSDGEGEGSDGGGSGDGEGGGGGETAEIQVDTIGYNPENPKQKLKKLTVTGTSWNSHVEENSDVEDQFPVCGRWRKWGLDYASLNIISTSTVSDSGSMGDEPALISDA